MGGNGTWGGAHNVLLSYGRHALRMGRYLPPQPNAVRVEAVKAAYVSCLRKLRMENRDERAPPPGRR